MRIFGALARIRTGGVPLRRNYSLFFVCNIFSRESLKSLILSGFLRLLFSSGFN